MKPTYTVKLGLKGLTSTALVERGRNHVAMMTLNSSTYANPTPALATITAACDKLDAANQAVLFNGGKLAYTQRNEADRELRDLIKELAGYVQAVSGGDKPTVQDGGFDVVEAGQPIGELDPPKALGNRLTTMRGRVALDWEPVYGARMYQVYMSTSNNPFNWQLTAVTTKSRLDVDSLEPGTFYWFAVSAVGAAGTSSMSDPAQAMAA